MTWVICVKGGDLLYVCKWSFLRLVLLAGMEGVLYHICCTLGNFVLNLVDWTEDVEMFVSSPQCCFQVGFYLLRVLSRNMIHRSLPKKGLCCSIGSWCLWLLMKLVFLGRFIPADQVTDMSSKFGYSNRPADCSLSLSVPNHMSRALHCIYSVVFDCTGHGYV